MKNQNKTVLVAGGAGFIGSHLCGTLLDRKYKVVCFDNFVSSSGVNIKHFLKNKKFTFIKHNIIRPYNAELPHIDEIYNLASPASPADFSKIPIEIMEVNSLGLSNMLKFARKNRVKLLYASTSEVYGDPLLSPQKETYWGNVNPNGPRSCYDESKRFGESVSFVYKRFYGVDVKIARIFNTYGPRMRVNDGRVISNFINQALKNKDITIYGDGKQTRSFCYVNDMVSGLIKLMESTESGPVNIGNPEEYTIIKVAKKIIKMTNSKSKIVFLPLPVDDPRRRKPDITFAKEKLSWRPQIKLNDGLRQTINYFKQNK